MMIMMTKKTVKAGPRTIGMGKISRRQLRRRRRTRRTRISRKMVISRISLEKIPRGYLGYKDC